MDIRASAIVVVLASICATPAFPSESVDCTALLSAEGATVDVAGSWAGTAESGGMSTRFELHIVEDRAFVSLPERAQYDFAVPVAASPSGRTLCLRAPYRSGVITLRRQGRGWNGDWVDPNFQAGVSLTQTRLPGLPRERPLDFVSSDGGRLAGTLVLPAAGSGPFPAIVWIHGSPPTTRDTWFYRGRAHMIARQGVASLIWDKRGTGNSTDARPWDIDRLTEDAQAAIEVARAAPEIADDGVVLAGFSQGGWIAPRVAADNAWLAGVIVGAAPGITIAEQNLYSFERALQSEGVPPELIAREVGLLRDAYSYYQTGEGYTALRARFDAPENRAFVNEPFFRRFLFQNGELPGPSVDVSDFSFMFADYLGHWRRVDAPVLAMWGADDNQVPATLSRERISAALAGRASVDDVFVIFDDATHSLYVNRNEGDPWDWERTPPGFQETVFDWMSRRRR